jgi:hypothetical protein
VLRQDPRHDDTFPPEPMAPRDLAKGYADLALEVRGLLREIRSDVAETRAASVAAKEAAYFALQKLGAFKAMARARFEALEGAKGEPLASRSEDTQTFLLRQLEQRDLAKEAKALRTLKGGAWHVTLAVCVAIALAILGLFGAALLSQARHEPPTLSAH